MHCTDRDTVAVRRAGLGPHLAVLFALAVPAAVLVGCSSPMPPPAPAPAPARPAARPPAPSANAARSWDEYRLRAAQKLVAANQGITYDGVPPEPLLAIPVLSVEVHADGSIAKIEVLRYPSKAKDTTQIAIDAMRRGAPYGDVTRLPKPWKFNETFLFNDDRHFKPMTLDR